MTEKFLKAKHWQLLLLMVAIPQLARVCNACRYNLPHQFVRTYFHTHAAKIIIKHKL